MDVVSNVARAGADDDPWEVTSVKMRRSTKRAVKLYAVEHDKTMQACSKRRFNVFIAEKSMK